MSFISLSELPTSEQLQNRRKELEVVLKILPHLIFSKKLILEGGFVASKAHADSVWKYLLNNDHKINGEFGQWSSGMFGSRWADVRLNGRNLRLAFYSRKLDDASFFKGINGDYILRVLTDY
jgi:hypothetical protein